MEKTIGFVGQGWLGKNYADHFEDRGFPVVRYSKEAPHTENKEKIATCDIVFACVPTPTTKEGFDDSIVREAAKLVGKGKTLVVKSTVLPGTTRSIQAENPDITVVFVPEFLREATVRYDIENPDRTIIGIVDESARPVAEELLTIFPKAPFENISSTEEAELTKYGSNVFLFWKVLFVNLFHDIATHHGADWDALVANLVADPRIGSSHMQPIHQIAHLGTTGRGAGGHCFIKDFAAFEEHDRQVVGDAKGSAVLEALRNKNIDLLVSSEKDLDLLVSVYGDEITKRP